METRLEISHSHSSGSARGDPKIVVFKRKKWRELENMSPTQAVKRTR